MSLPVRSPPGNRTCSRGQEYFRHLDNSSLSHTIFGQKQGNRTIVKMKLFVGYALLVAALFSVVNAEFDENFEFDAVDLAASRRER